MKALAAKAARFGVAWNVVKAAFFSGALFGLIAGMFLMAGLTQAPTAQRLLQAWVARHAGTLPF